MKDEISDIINKELDEKEVTMEEMSIDYSEELKKLEEEHNKKIQAMTEEEVQKMIDERANLTGEDLMKMQEEALQEAMKYINRDDN